MCGADAHELMVGAAAAGAVAGLIRIGEGGHFLSDVVFAGVIMALVVALMYWLVFDVRRAKGGKRGRLA